MCGNKPSSVITILYCSGQMVDDGNKDAEFFISFFKSKVDEFDLRKTLTDIFFVK